jgi:hypothetical protein
LSPKQNHGTAASDVAQACTPFTNLITNTGFETNSATGWMSEFNAIAILADNPKAGM